MIIKIPKDTRLEYNSWRGSCMLPTSAKILAKIMECIQKKQKKLYQQKAGWFPLTYTDQINTPPIILEQCVNFKSPLHLLFIDFQKGFLQHGKRVNMECFTQEKPKMPLVWINALTIK